MTRHGKSASQPDMMGRTLMQSGTQSLLRKPTIRDFNINRENRALVQRITAVKSVFDPQRDMRDYQNHRRVVMLHQEFADYKGRRPLPPARDARNLSRPRVPNSLSDSNCLTTLLCPWELPAKPSMAATMHVVKADKHRNEKVSMDTAAGQLATSGEMQNMAKAAVSMSSDFLEGSASQLAETMSQMGGRETGMTMVGAAGGMEAGAPAENVEALGGLAGGGAAKSVDLRSSEVPLKPQAFSDNEVSGAPAEGGGPLQPPDFRNSEGSGASGGGPLKPPDFKNSDGSGGLGGGPLKPPDFRNSEGSGVLGGGPLKPPDFKNSEGSGALGGGPLKPPDFKNSDGSGGLGGGPLKPPDFRNSEGSGVLGGGPLKPPDLQNSDGSGALGGGPLKPPDFKNSEGSGLLGGGPLKPPDFKNSEGSGGLAGGPLSPPEVRSPDKSRDAAASSPADGTSQGAAEAKVAESQLPQSSTASLGAAGEKKSASNDVGIFGDLNFGDESAPLKPPEFSKPKRRRERG